MLMLMDKGYYDYDYEAVKHKATLTEADREIWSQDKLNAILGVRPKKLTPDELRPQAMKNMQTGEEMNEEQQEQV